MRKLFVAAALVAASLPVGSAHAVPDGLGFLCGFASNDDPTGVIANPNTQVGVEYGGPLVVADLPLVSIDTTTLGVSLGNNPVTASMTCWIQINGTGYANDTASVVTGTVKTGPTLPEVAILPGAEIQFPDATNTWQCTRVDVTDSDGNHTTLYGDTTDPNGTVFTTDSSRALCGLATTQDEGTCVDGGPAGNVCVPPGSPNATLERDVAVGAAAGRGVRDLGGHDPAGLRA